MTIKIAEANLVDQNMGPSFGQSDIIKGWTYISINSDHKQFGQLNAGPRFGPVIKGRGSKEGIRRARPKGLSILAGYTE